MTRDAENDWLAPRGGIVSGGVLRPAMALRIDDGKIADIRPRASLPRGARVRALPGTLAPGLVDLQVNGGGGVLFNAEPSAEGLAIIAAAHRARGTTRFLPTVISDAPDVLERAVDAVIACHGRFGIAGLHVEGPHISQVRRGVHAARWVRPFEEATLVQVVRARDAGVPVLVTLAPEVVAPWDIERLVDAGAVVALGHSEAPVAKVQEAILAGARAVTHLFNAMPPLAGRDPGLAGTALDSSLVCTFIADGHHVDDTMLRLAFRARPAQGLNALVSDAMPTLGGPPSFSLYGETIRAEGGRLVSGEGRLAGAHIALIDAVRHCVHALGMPLAEAIAMAGEVPARLMGLDVPRIAPGAAAEIVLLSDDLRSAIPWPELGALPG